MAHVGWNGRTLPSCVDAVVVGAGPVGCVAALALAQRGAEVLLLEAHPHSSRRLAGEWLHPPAVRLLRHLEVENPLFTADASSARQGFVAIAGHGSEAILLNYADGTRGLSCEHAVLVEALRDAVRARPGVTFVSRAHVTAVDGQTVTIEQEQPGEVASVIAGQVIAASGRSALARGWLGSAGESVTLSYAAGVTLDDVELPFEGFGHLLLGGPGPILAYRLDSGRVRVCLDVPVGQSSARDAARYLWRGYGGSLPPDMRPAFRRALETGPILWAANRVRPRRTYGRKGLVFVGDAVGHFHPLTAVGITVGFGDAECVARSSDFAAYERERRSSTRVAELLATSLYAMCTYGDEGSLAIREAIYEMWRRSPKQRDRTMSYLSTENTNPVHFAVTFLGIMGLALRTTAGQALATHRWSTTSEAVHGLAAWLRWLGQATLQTPALPPPLITAAEPGIHPALQEPSSDDAVRSRPEEFESETGRLDARKIR